MTKAVFEDYYNRSMSGIWESILWIDQKLEAEPNPEKEAELDKIMERLKAVMKLKRLKSLTQPEKLLFAGNRIGHGVLPVDHDGCWKIGGPDG